MRQTFSGGLSGELSGNASTAAKLKTARKISNVAFDGSSDITLKENSHVLSATGPKHGRLALRMIKQLDGTGVAEPITQLLNRHRRSLFFSNGELEFVLQLASLIFIKMAVAFFHQPVMVMVLKPTGPNFATTTRKFRRRCLESRYLVVNVPIVNWASSSALGNGRLYPGAVRHGL